MLVPCIIPEIEQKGNNVSHVWNALCDRHVSRYAAIHYHYEQGIGYLSREMKRLRCRQPEVCSSEERLDEGVNRLKRLIRTCGWTELEADDSIVAERIQQPEN